MCRCVGTVTSARLSTDAIHSQRMGDASVWFPEDWTSPQSLCCLCTLEHEEINHSCLSLFSSPSVFTLFCSSVILYSALGRTGKLVDLCHVRSKRRLSKEAEWNSSISTLNGKWMHGDRCPAAAIRWKHWVINSMTDSSWGMMSLPPSSSDWSLTLHMVQWWVCVAEECHESNASDR